MTKNQAWILATRPKTLLASIGPVILGLAVAYSLSGKLNIVLAIATLLCAILMQIGTNLVNDYFDFKKGVDDKDRLGPTRVTSSGLLSEEEVKKGYMVTFSLALLIGIYLMIMGGLPIVIICISSLIVAYCYTGGPFPLSYNALGELAALIFFGPVAVWGTYFLQTLSFDKEPALIGLGPGFIAAAILAVNNLRDIESDRKSGKTTIASFCGADSGKLLILVFILASTFMPLYLAASTSKQAVVGGAFVAYFFIRTWKRIVSGPINAELNECLASTAKYLFIYCIVTSILLVV